jgi:uncharacterized membrane protein
MIKIDIKVKVGKYLKMEKVLHMRTSENRTGVLSLAVGGMTYLLQTLFTPETIYYTLVSRTIRQSGRVDPRW